MLNTNSNIKPYNNRSSNLELYRIISMLMIIAHHYVVNSGLIEADGPIYSNINSLQSILLFIVGGFGKTGINCFILITGYFMCKSNISLKKFLKLYGEIVFYGIGIYFIFILAGRDSFSITQLIKRLMPFYSLQSNFTNCFVAFWLTIPFLNSLIQNINEKKHIYLLCLLGFSYIILPSLSFSVSINYMMWFGVLYLFASYIRLYPKKVFFNNRLWGCATLFFLFISIASIVILSKYGNVYFFMFDSNKILAFMLGLSSFMFFLNLNIPYIKSINILGSTTFGILQIHAHSDAMRQWLWKDFLNNVNAYYMGPMMIFHLLTSVFGIFIVCSFIDIFRIHFIERPYLNFIDRHQSKWINCYKKYETKLFDKLQISNTYPDIK